MSRSSINFNYKKIKKSDFYNKMKKYINKFDKFDEKKITMSLMIKDKQFSKNYSKIWRKKNWKINENRLMINT